MLWGWGTTPATSPAAAEVKVDSQEEMHPQLYGAIAKPEVSRSAENWQIRTLAS